VAYSPPAPAIDQRPTPPMAPYPRSSDASSTPQNPVKGA